MFKKKNIKKIIVIFIITFAVLTCVKQYLLNANTANVDSKKNFENVEKDIKVQETYNTTYDVLAMGDSLAKGTGDKTGNGFAKDFSKIVERKVKKPVNVTNIAVDGDTSSGLLNMIQKDETIKYIKKSKFILISIGGNEVIKLRNSKLESILKDKSKIQNKYMDNLNKIFKVIRKNNSKCIIAVIGLYNPAGKVAPLEAIVLLETWNNETEQFVTKDSKAVFISTYNLFKDNVQKYIAEDKFHPNAEGYKLISKEIEKKVKNKY